MSAGQTQTRPTTNRSNIRGFMSWRNAFSPTASVCASFGQHPVKIFVQIIRAQLSCPRARR
jgi:hypothetical protein